MAYNIRKWYRVILLICFWVNFFRKEISMINIPEVKIGIVAVSRDCFPASLAENRRKALAAAYKKAYGDKDIYECPICIIESEIDMVNALEDIR